MRHEIIAWLIVLGILAPVMAESPELKPVNLDTVNSARDEDEPFSTGHGQLYFTAGRGDDIELYVSKKTARGWGPGQRYNDLEDKGTHRGLFIAFPRSTTYPQTIFFTTNLDSRRDNGKGDNFDIYMMERRGPSGGDFNVPIPINAICTGADELHPWLAPEGKLYFSRKTKEGWRTFVAMRPKSNLPFGKPTVVELPVGFHHPTLTPDGRTMYLQGPLEGDRIGLFRSNLSGGKWSAPEPLVELNHPQAATGDRSPSLSKEGGTLYFASDRPGGKGGLDLWSISTAQLVKKK
jgi:hypothetical protein